MRESYPLQWPDGWARSKSPTRSTAFRVAGFARPRDALVAEIKRMGGNGIVITTDLPTKTDGLPYATHSEPNDPGVAVYWHKEGREQVMACDRWDRVRDNLHALELSVAALRGLARWGSTAIVERAFSGFLALPAAPEPVSWRKVFGINPAITPSWDGVKVRFRQLVQERHPDRGGTEGAMAELNIALAQAVEEYQARGDQKAR